MKSLPTFRLLMSPFTAAAFVSRLHEKILTKLKTNQEAPCELNVVAVAAEAGTDVIYATAAEASTSHFSPTLM